MPGRCLDSVRVERHGPHTWLLLYQPVEHLCIEGVGGRLRVFPLLGRVHREAVRPTGEQKLSRKGKSCHLTHTQKKNNKHLCAWSHGVFQHPHLLLPPGSAHPPSDGQALCLELHLGFSLASPHHPAPSYALQSLPHILRHLYLNTSPAHSQTTRTRWLTCG